MFSSSTGAPRHTSMNAPNASGSHGQRQGQAGLPKGYNKPTSTKSFSFNIFKTPTVAAGSSHPYTATAVFDVGYYNPGTFHRNTSSSKPSGPYPVPSSHAIATPKTPSAPSRRPSLSRQRTSSFKSTSHTSSNLNANANPASNYAINSSHNAGHNNYSIYRNPSNNGGTYIYERSLSSKSDLVPVNFTDDSDERSMRLLAIEAAESAGSIHGSTRSGSSSHTSSPSATFSPATSLASSFTSVGSGQFGENQRYQSQVKQPDLFLPPPAPSGHTVLLPEPTPDHSDALIFDQDDEAQARSNPFAEMDDEDSDDEDEDISGIGLLEAPARRSTRDSLLLIDIPPPSKAGPHNRSQNGTSIPGSQPPQSYFDIPISTSPEEDSLRAHMYHQAQSQAIYSTRREDALTYTEWTPNDTRSNPSSSPTSSTSSLARKRSYSTFKHSSSQSTAPVAIGANQKASPPLTHPSQRSDRPLPMPPYPTSNSFQSPPIDPAAMNAKLNALMTEPSALQSSYNNHPNGSYQHTQNPSHPSSSSFQNPSLSRRGSISSSPGHAAAPVAGPFRNDQGIVSYTMPTAGMRADSGITAAMQAMTLHTNGQDTALDRSNTPSPTQSDRSRGSHSSRGGSVAGSFQNSSMTISSIAYVSPHGHPNASCYFDPAFSGTAAMNHDYQISFGPLPGLPSTNIPQPPYTAPFFPPERRYSDGDSTQSRPDMSNPELFRRHSGGIKAPRNVRWTEDLVCPSPIFPPRKRQGWYNRKGDQLWTNNGQYKVPPPGQEYPPDLDGYPEVGEGWMNEDGIRIDMGHHRIPKVPLRSALKQARTA